MIGPKKLSTIRAELRRALTTTDVDPIRWLEDRMTAPKRKGDASSGGGEVLRSLRRILEPTASEKKRSRRAGTKR